VIEKRVIAHITSVHSRYDTRIFLKECSSLKRISLDVNLIVADGLDDEIRNGIQILNIKKNSFISNRLFRMLFFPFLFFKKIKSLKPELIHFHDPELILLGIFLKKIGFKVIYDIHEDVESQILSKFYIPKFYRGFISLVVKNIESYAAKRLTGLITATPFLHEKFSLKNKNTALVNNYPIINELSKSGDYTSKKNCIVFLGGITRIRGIENVVKSLSNTKSKLNLVGNFQEPKFKEYLMSTSNWEKVNYYGFCDRTKSAEILSKSFAGIVTFDYAKNHINSQPNKLFEYMSAGLPVIASNFGLWKEIVQGSKCGVCVDPNDIDQITTAINFLHSNPKKAQKMGKNGKKAILEKFNWSLESEKLINFYKKILS
jgi:glycosyltransferase involved in cell wall biosynthesis